MIGIQPAIARCKKSNIHTHTPTRVLQDFVRGVWDLLDHGLTYILGAKPENPGLTSSQLTSSRSSFGASHAAPTES